jgi:hypothetical protein
MTHSRFAWIAVLTMVLASAEGFAQELIEIGGENVPRAVTLVVSEDDHGSAQAAAIALQGPEELQRDPRWVETFEETYFSGLVFLSAGSRGGLSALRGAIEAGLDVSVGLYAGLVGPFVQGGVFAHIAPIPGAFGQRLYAHGRVFRLYGMGIMDTGTTFAYRGRELGMGYRHRKSARDRDYWFAELAWMDARGDIYRDLRLPMISIGFRGAAGR